jgi:2-oxoglutarate ferredoxin oxidoreductase subunit alpha
VEQARSRGIKVGMLRLVTIWPVPEEVVARWAEKVHTLLMPEMNLGQMVHPMKEAVAGRCEVVLLPKIGGELHNPAEILDVLEKVR